MAIVTGAGSGLGRAVVEQFAADGAAVAALDVNLPGAEETVQGVLDAGGTARAYAVDVGDPESVETAVGKAVADLGRASMLVNCAGIGKFAHSHEIDPAEWERIIRVNLTGTFLMCRYTLPFLLDGGGNIVNIASNAGLMAQPYSAAYCSSKAGVVHLTKALADEYVSRAVRVNAVAPGGIETPLQNSFSQLPEGVHWKELRKVISPLGNSTAEEIARIIAFVASDDARYMTGSIISVDGGLTV